MKKLLTVILILALALPAAALAAIPDISGLSTDELLELNRQIQLRLFSEQLVNGVEINPGIYVVGKDIPAGSYRADAIVPAGTFMVGYVAVYMSEEVMSEVFGCIFGQGTDKTGKFTLEDGQVFEVSAFPIKLYPFTGLFN